MSIFNKPTGSIFGGNQPQQQQGMTNSIFGGNQQQPQQQQQQGVNLFGGNQQQPSTNIFGGNQTQQQTSNIFGGNQQQPATNIFGGNQQQQQQTNMFTQQKTGLFNTQQPQQQQGINPFGGQQQQQQGGMFGNQQQQTNFNQPIQSNFIPTNDTQIVRSQIQQFCRRVDPKNLQHIRIDEMNNYKNYRLSDLPEDIKKPIMILVNNMRDLKRIIDTLKKENEQLDNKAASYCKSVQQKLFKYKQCLIQNIQQTNLLEQVKQQVQMIQKQLQNCIIPLYNAHLSGKRISFDTPDEFSSTIAKNILQKMIQLNNKLDEIISCQQTNDGDSMSQRDSTTVLVLQQLLNYYMNVSAKVFEFTSHYNKVKQAKIQSIKRTSSYEQMIRRIQDKVNTKMQKDFKSYDLIKQIQSILQKRQKRQQQLNSDYYREQSDRRFN